MSTIRVAIAGATGYSGEELIRLLLQHPQVQLTYLAASAKWERPTAVSVVYPRFARQLDLPIESLDRARLLKAADMIFLALPHGTAIEIVPELLDAGKRVIDLSGDFRLRDPALYPKWYKFSHPHPEFLILDDLAYGLTEFYQDAIKKARLVANPGCYATSILLGCLPLFQANLVEDGDFLIDAKSGFSGAGRKPELAAEMAENLRPYKVNEHPHMPEVVQTLSQLTGHRPTLGFVPQVLPVVRGLISMLYIKTKADAGAIRKAYQTAYPRARTPFVRVRAGSFPQLRDVVETNYCDIGWIYNPSLGHLMVASALDNLTKGAAGQAVQNFNVMCGFPETTALN